MAEPLTLHWLPVEDDLRRAYDARRYALGFRRRELVMVAGLMVAGVLVAVLGQPVVAVVLAVVAVVFAFPATGAALASRSIHRLWRANPFLAEPAEASLTDDGYHQHSDNRDISLAWKSFSTWIDAPEALVLNLSGKQNGASITIPDRAASDPAELEAVRALLRDHLGDAVRR
jgi:YcxB-like protein